ncbi:MAG: hypothetical protein LBF87_03245 [Treponema sp.]|nr:hypothetical protein [Treponema sp.]
MPFLSPIPSRPMSRFSNSKYRHFMLNSGMGQGIFKSLIETFSREREQMPDYRRPGHNERCNIADVVKSAFADSHFVIVSGTAGWRICARRGRCRSGAVKAHKQQSSIHPR